MRRPLCVFCAGTLGLELVCAFLPQTGRFVPFAAFFIVGLLWALVGRLRKSPAWGYGICLILGAVLGLVLTGSTQAKWDAIQTAYDGRSVLLEAEVESTTSSYFPGRVRAVLRVETVNREAASLRVECASLPTCSPGDRVKGRFALEMPDDTARLNALTSLGVAGVLMTAGNSYAVCDVGFQLSFAAVVGTLAGGAVVRRSQEAWEKQRAKKKRPRLRFWKRKALGLAGSLWETVCISACASMATFPVLVLRGMSTSLYALVSGAAVLWLVEPILLTGLGAALLGLVPALAPAQRVCSCCAEFLAEVLDHWALWVSGWPGAQIWFDTAYAAVVCLLLAGLCWLAFHNRVRLRVALPALLLTAGLAVFTGNALNRDVVRVELVGSRNAPAVVISRNESAVILFRGGDVTRSAVETTLERRNIRTVECLIDLRLRPRSAQRMGAEQRIAVDRMALYATRRVRCSPAEVEVLRTRNGCVARIHAAGQTFVTLSGSAALAAPVQADTLLASPARPDCVKYDAILSLSSDYRWMPEALSSEQLCHSFSRAEQALREKIGFLSGAVI